MINTPTIIYLDDSIESLRLIDVATHSDSRFKLEFVTSGRDLINKMTNKKYAAVLIDLNLGIELSGTIVAAKIRESYPEIPIVIYTGYSEDRVKKLIDKEELEKGLTQVWIKSDMDINLIADKLVSLLKE